MKKGLLLALLAVAAVAVPLALAFHDLARVILAELIRLVWTARLLVDSLPQLSLWTLLLVVAGLAAAASLLGTPARHTGRARQGREPGAEAGQVRELSTLVRQATERDYYRWSLDHYLTGLAWEAVAQRHQISLAEARRQVRAGEIDLPPAMAAYLQATAVPRPGAARGRRRQARATPGAPRPSIEEIVRFLEEQVEVKDVRGPR